MKPISDRHLARADDRDSAVLFFPDLLAAFDEVDYSLLPKILSLHWFL